MAREAALAGLLPCAAGYPSALETCGWAAPRDRWPEEAMYVVTLHGPRDVRLNLEPDIVGTLAAHDIKVRTVTTAVSTGTEMSAYTASYGLPFYGWPYPSPSMLGYLNVGTVEEVGVAVTSVASGDLIYTFRQHCQEYVLSDTEPRWLVPTGLDPGVAGFAYLIALGGHALRRASLLPGEHVAVVGLGALGLGAVAMARFYGCRVTAIDTEPYRRQLAGALGADEVVDPLSTDVSRTEADIVVEAAGTWPAVATSIDAVRDLGRVSVVGLHPSAGDVNVLGETFYRKQIALFSTAAIPKDESPSTGGLPTLRRSCQETLDGLAAGRIEYAAAVTHRIPFRELPALYAALDGGQVTAGAIAVLWDSAP